MKVANLALKFGLEIVAIPAFASLFALAALALLNASAASHRVRLRGCHQRHLPHRVRAIGPIADC